jgi:hypothetical protein
MEGRTDPITLVGSAPGRDQPGVEEFVERVFGTSGAWPYMWSFDGFAIRPVELPSQPDDPTHHEALRRDGLLIRSVAVPHGPMHTAAYRIEHGDTSIVVSGEIQREHQPLVELAAGCDVLVHDFALPEREIERGHLHTKPREVARIATAARCRRPCSHTDAGTGGRARRGAPAGA